MLQIVSLINCSSTVFNLKLLHMWVFATFNAQKTFAMVWEKLASIGIISWVLSNVG